MKACDFSRSFLTFRIDLKEQQPTTLSHKSPTTLNNARISLECICNLENSKTGESFRYVLGASCKTERVGVPKDIWLKPVADFCVITSDEEFMILKSWQRNDMKVMRHPESLGAQPERQAGLTKEAWTSLKIKVSETEAAVLNSVDEIIDATFEGMPLVSRMEYDDSSYHVRIENPVKTFNVNEREKIYQTDTGPVLLPDFSRLSGESRLVEVFDLAFSAFNCPQWAEFVVNVPTAIAEGVSANTYSKTRRIENMKNTIVMLKD